MPSQSRRHHRSGRRRTLPDQGRRSLCGRAGDRSHPGDRRPLCDCERRTGFRHRQRVRRQWLWRALPGWIQLVLRSGGRGRADHDVPVHHHGCNPWQGPDGLRSDCHWARADADPPGRDPGHKPLGQSGPQHRAGALRRGLGTCTALAVLGGAPDRGSARRHPLPLAQRGTLGASDRRANRACRLRAPGQTLAMEHGRATGGLSGGCPHPAELLGAHTSSTTGEGPMNSGQIVIKPASTFEPRFNLFRHREMSDLCCAVPEDRPVPSFIRGELWEFVGAVGGRSAAPGFEQTEAVLSVRLNGFPLFQMIAPLRSPGPTCGLSAGRTDPPAPPLRSELGMTWLKSATVGSCGLTCSQGGSHEDVTDQDWLESRGGDYDGEYHATWPAIEIVAFVTLALAEQATGGNTSHDTDRLRTRPAGGAVTGAGTSALSVGYPSAFPTLNRGHDVHSVFKAFAPDLCHK